MEPFDTGSGSADAIEEELVMEAIAVEGQMRLLARRRALLWLAKGTSDSESELLGAKELDEVDASANQGAARVLEQLSENEVRELREIEAALERVKEGRYGRCERCGAAIGRLRLRAIPEARCCLSCIADEEVAA